MTVSYDLFTGFKSSATGATPWSSFDHTQGATADFVVVMVAWEENTTIASVTYGGTTMNAGTIAGPGASSATRVQFFWLPAASMGASGTKAVVVTPTGVATGYVGVWTVIGADQNEPVRTDTDAGASASTTTVELTSVPTGSAVLSGNDNNFNTTTPTLSGGTQRYSQALGTPSFSSGSFGDSFGSGTITHVWTLGTATRYATLMVEILESAALTQAMPPDAILASTNLSGTVGAIDEDPTSPAGDWLTATSATSATDIRVSFGTPPGSPRVG